MKCIIQQKTMSILFDHLTMDYLRIVPPFVTANSFCASWDVLGCMWLKTVQENQTLEGTDGIQKETWG